MRPLYNQQGGHELLDLHKKRVITRRKVTTIPITPSIIQAVESIAAQEGMKGLKVRTNTGQTLYDSSWITGVDYDEDEDDLDYETDDEDEEDEDEEEQYDKIDQEEIIELLDDQPNNNQTEEQQERNPEEVLEQQNEEIVFTEEESDEETDDEVEDTQQRRSNRERTQTKHYEPTFEGKQYSHLITQVHEQTEYDVELAKVAAIIIDNMNEISVEARESGMSFMETYNLKKGVMKFGERGSQAALQHASK